MTKDFRLARITCPAVGTADTIYKCTLVDMLNNTGKVPIRVDKVLSQISGYHNGAGPMMIGTIVLLSDETGGTPDADITSGTTTLAQLEAILQVWRDYIWMSDFRVLGTGQDETQVFVSELSADTRRILNPGQKLSVLCVVMPMSAETTKYAYLLFDGAYWYSAQ